MEACSSSSFAAKALAQRQAPGLVDASAEGRVQDELHAAAVVKEALGDDGCFGGYGAEDGTPGDHIGDQLQRTGAADPALILQPEHGVRKLSYWLLP